MRILKAQNIDSEPVIRPDTIQIDLLTAFTLLTESRSSLYTVKITGDTLHLLGVKGLSHW